MPTKLNDSFDQKPYNPQIVAAAYAHRRMEDFVNTINAASYPHPPEQTGGKVYKHCRDYFEQCAEIVGEDNASDLPAEKKDALRANAIESLRILVDNLCDDTALNASEQRYLNEFIFFKAITDKLLAGKSMAEVRKFIETAPIGQDLPPEP